MYSLVPVQHKIEKKNTVCFLLLTSEENQERGRETERDGGGEREEG